MKNNDNFIMKLIDGLAKILISEIFSSQKDDYKMPPSQEKTQDLGYAVVVDDNGNEI